MGDREMTKQEQIEEMPEILEKSYIDAQITCGSLNQGFGMWYAEPLYNAGYKQEKEVRKETAKEILQQIYNLCKVRDSIQFDDIYYLVNRYGVEIEK